MTTTATTTPSTAAASGGEPALRDLGLLVLRLVPAIGLGAHGFSKLADPTAGSGVFAMMGFPAPETMAVVTGLLEVGTALLLVLGAASALAGAGVVGIMTVAIWRVHGDFGFFFDNGAQPDAVAPVPGYEYSLALLLLGAAIAASGAGRYSLDATALRRLPAILRGGTVPALGFALAVGLVGGAIAALVLR